MEHNFETCLEWLLKHEGGFVNHPEDPGGMTNKGITAKVYARWLDEVMDADANVTEEIMRNIPDAHVAAIYREEYWNRVNGDDLPAGVDWSVFDWAVNSGTGRAARAIQRCVGAKADGAIGPKTLAAIRERDAASLIEDMFQRRQEFYEKLSTFETFGKGWSNRNRETREQALTLARP